MPSYPRPKLTALRNSSKSISHFYSLEPSGYSLTSHAVDPSCLSIFWLVMCTFCAETFKVSLSLSYSIQVILWELSFHRPNGLSGSFAKHRFLPYKELCPQGVPIFSSFHCHISMFVEYRVPFSQLLLLPPLMPEWGKGNPQSLWLTDKGQESKELNRCEPWDVEWYETVKFLLSSLWTLHNRGP